MGSPFKMKPKTPMMKALVGKQGNLPQHLQDKIKAAPESPAKSYGSKTKSPVMQKDTKGKRKFGEADAETREKQSIGTAGTGMRRSAGQRKVKIGGTTLKGDFGKVKGNTDLLQVAKDSYSKAKKYVKGKLGIPKMVPPPKKNRKPGKNDKMLTKIKENYKPEKPTKNPDSPRSQVKKKPKLKMRDIRERGVGSPVKKRKISEKAAKRKATKGKGMITKTYGGKTQSSKFVKFTKEGRKQAKTTGMVSSKNMKKPTPIKKKGVKALEAQRGTKNPSPIKKHGSKKSPVMQQKLKKKDTKGKTKLPKLVVNTPKGPKAPRGPQKGTIKGVHVSIQTKGRSTKNTDLLPYLKGRGKGSGARARKRSRS